MRRGLQAEKLAPERAEIDREGALRWWTGWDGGREESIVRVGLLGLGAWCRAGKGGFA
jgi:hypothetical protein